MAVTLDTHSGGFLAAYGSSVLTFAHTISGANETLLVHGNGRVPTGVTYAGVSMTLVRSATGGAIPASSVWALLNPPAGTANVVVTTDSPYAAGAYEASSWAGADQTAMVGSSVGYDDGYAPAAVAMTVSVPAGGVSVGMCSGNIATATVAATAPATQLASRNTEFLSSFAWSTHATQLAWLRSEGMQTTSIAVVLLPAGGSDATPPTHTGSLSASAVTSTSYTLAWPAAADNVAVTGYEYSLDGGTSYTSLGVGLSVAVTGRTPGATDAVRVRAFDGTGNRSTPALSASVTLLSASTGGTLTPAPIKNNTGTVQSSIAGLQVKVYDAAGALVVAKVISSDASGNIPITDAAITAGAAYYGLLVHPASGAFGSFKVVAT